jgi:type VI secretion system protein ImpG
MDPRLLEYYEAELEYLRVQSLEFAERHEAAATNLGLTGGERDPYVERLLEGVAFLSSRVQLKLDDQFPEFTQHLLQAVQPHYLAPTPSICIVGIEPVTGDPGLARGHIVERGTQLSAEPQGNSRTPLIFQSGHAVTLWPLTIAAAEYLGSRAAAAKYADLAGVRAQAALTLRIEAQDGVDLSKIAADELPLFLDGGEGVANELYRQLIGEAVAVVARPLDTAGAAHVLLETPAQHGFGEDCALLPDDGRTLSAYRMLTEYFACPEAFRFVKLRTLRRALALSEKAVEITILFSRSSDMLVQSVSTRNFRLFATPAINLFEKQLSRIGYSDETHEFKVVADRDGPLDFEVFRLLKVEAYDRENQNPREVAPLYSYGSLLYDYRSAIFYTTRLRLRQMSRKERRQRKREDYVGTDMFLTLTSPGDPARLDTVHHIALRALVTNRELPVDLKVSGDFHLSASGVPARGIKILRPPTRPLPPLGIGDAAWRVIGHLTPNYATLVGENGGNGEMLRNHLALYGRPDDPVTRSQIDGIVGVRGEHVTRRVPGIGRMALARGLRISIELDDAAFDQARLFLFSAVIERFLAGFVTVNSFTETRFHTKAQGEVAVWPPRIGTREPI